jgi:hypothetical protein
LNLKREGGIACQSVLQAEQLVAVVGGFVGFVDEFPYDDGGVDTRFYVLSGTKFVVDTRGHPQIIHNFRRSLCPKCVVKMMKCGGLMYAGVFSGVSDVNGIAKRTRREKFSIAAGTELLLPIDFAPATIEEPQEFMSWHFDEIPIAEEIDLSPPPTKHSEPRASSPQKHVRPSREERDEIAAIRLVDRTKKRRKKDGKEEIPKVKIKKKPGKPPRSQKHMEVVECSLFNLMRSPNVDLMFSLPSLDEAEGEDDELARREEIENDARVGCAFLDKFLVETAPFEPMKVGDPIAEMMSLLNLKDLE